MPSSSTGELFVVTNFGESHGPAVGCVIDGCPPGLPLAPEDIQRDLDRRRPGRSRHVSQRREEDRVEILSGVFEGLTEGTPIALLIRNADARSEDYRELAEVFRPAHADWGYAAKFGVRDPRGGGRASARLTAPTVAAGAVARLWLRRQLGVEIRARLSRVGELTLPLEDWSQVDRNPFFAAGESRLEELAVLLDRIREEGDSVGAELELEILGVPAGWGSPVYRRLDATLAAALMGVNAVKAVAIGDGFAVAAARGSDNADPLTPAGFASNHAGGILGGISTSAPITARVAVKPTPSIRRPLATIDARGRPTTVSTKGRHDPCVGLRATPVLEAVAALALIDAALAQRAQCGDLGRSAWPASGER